MPIFSHRSYVIVDVPANLKALSEGAPNARIKADGTLQLKNTDTGKYHTPSVEGPDGTPFPVITDFGQS